VAERAEIDRSTLHPIEKGTHRYFYPLSKKIVCQILTIDASGWDGSVYRE